MKGKSMMKRCFPALILALGMAAPATAFYVGGDDYEVRWPGSGRAFGTEFRTAAAGQVTSLLVTGFTLAPAAAAAVPEPAAWLLMIAGFGATGATLRRRRPHRVALA
jgi:hypothetical protein